MTNPGPEEKIRIILEVLKKNEIPAIINVAAGGLVIPKDYDRRLFHFVSQIPYEWILPKMYAIMHPGGSGTTHLAVKYGCASIIIPHIRDQHVWNDLNVKLGVGPKGVSVHKLSITKLESLLHELWNNKKFKTIAKTRSDEIRNQTLTQELMKELTH